VCYKGVTRVLQACYKRDGSGGGGGRSNGCGGGLVVVVFIAICDDGVGVER
jgi:hypothetical protein